MSSTMRVVAAICFTVLSVSLSPAGAAEDGLQLDLFGRVGAFAWEEAVNGIDLLEESGVLYGLGGMLDVGFTETWRGRARGTLFAGDVDYDGSLQVLSDGSLIPYRSTTGYVGIDMAFDLLAVVPAAADTTVMPYAGLGGRVWRRRLGEGEANDFGYDEDWTTLHAACGIELQERVSDDVLVWLRGEYRLGLRNRVSVEVVDFFGTRDVTLDPGERSTFHAAGGVCWRRLLAEAFYETYRSGASAEDPTTGFLQPRADSDFLALQAGVRF